METLGNGQRAVYIRLRNFDVLGILKRESGGVASTGDLLVISGNRHFSGGCRVVFFIGIAIASQCY
jgi:hypothetical protein